MNESIERRKKWKFAVTHEREKKERKKERKKEQVGSRKKKKVNESTERKNKNESLLLEIRKKESEEVKL